MEPVALAVSPDNRYVWVVNHLSDSISVVDVALDVPLVIETLQVGDEPRDIVFAGPDHSRVFITTAHRGQNNPNDPQMLITSVGRADIWVFDSVLVHVKQQEPLVNIVTVFGDTPRALAASADGEKVYAGIFRSGNRTTTLWPDAINNIQKPAPNDSISESSIIITTGPCPWCALVPVEEKTGGVVSMNLVTQSSGAASITAELHALPDAIWSRQEVPLIQLFRNENAVPYY